MSKIIDLPKDSPAVASIKASIETFKADPPDDEFQRGYLSALEDLLEQVFEAEQDARQDR